MRVTLSSVVVLTIALSSSGLAATAQHGVMPPGMSHEAHLAQLQREAEMKARGAVAMGFDQDTTTHHFRLTPGGGTIEVSVNDAADTDGREQIRRHLREIAIAFSSGRFEKPFATHGEMPPGVDTMTQLASSITYAFEETPRGGLVRLTASDARAISAVHDFLRYQIREHEASR